MGQAGKVRSGAGKWKKRQADIYVSNDIITTGT